VRTGGAEAVQGSEQNGDGQREPGVGGTRWQQLRVLRSNVVTDNAGGATPGIGLR